VRNGVFEDSDQKAIRELCQIYDLKVTVQEDGKDCKSIAVKKNNSPKWTAIIQFEKNANWPVRFDQLEAACLAKGIIKELIS
jgi:hypothetical protein